MRLLVVLFPRFWIAESHQDVAEIEPDVHASAINAPRGTGIAEKRRIGAHASAAQNFKHGGIVVLV